MPSRFRFGLDLPLFFIGSLSPLLDYKWCFTSPLDLCPLLCIKLRFNSCPSSDHWLSFSIWRWAACRWQEVPFVAYSVPPMSLPLYKRPQLPSLKTSHLSGPLSVCASACLASLPLPLVFPTQRQIAEWPVHPRFLTFSYLLFVFHHACLVSTHATWLCISQSAMLLPALVLSALS